MRNIVPMCGSIASIRSADTPAQQHTHTSAMLLIALHTAVPVCVHLFGRWNLLGPHQTKAEPLRIGVIPDALRQLRILLLPRRVGCNARAAPAFLRVVRPRSA